jgi:ATP/maltotriose-dependent transcriptional regulator MalT
LHLWLIALGYGNKKLSKSLGLSLGTVKNHISSIYSKLAVDNRRQAVLLIAALKSRAAGIHV